MSKVMLALGSFTVGACSMLLIPLGVQTFTSAQPVFAQARAFVVGGAEPTFPPLSGKKFEDTVIENFVQPLDGFECERCKFKDVTFAYSGGAYSLKDCSITGPIRLSLKGAALNTFGAIQFFAALEAVRQPKNPPPLKPLIKPYNIPNTTKITLISPYGQR